MQALKVPWLAEHELHSHLDWPSIHALLFHCWWLPVGLIWVCTTRWRWMTGSGWGCCTCTASGLAFYLVLPQWVGWRWAEIWVRTQPGWPSQTEQRNIPCCTTSWSAIKGFFRKQTLLRGWQDLLVCFWEVVSDGLHIIILGGFFLPPSLSNFLSQQKFCDSVGKCGA